MSEPLGRDRLGRLVYSADTATLDSGKRAFVYGRKFDFIDVGVFDDHEDRFVSPFNLIVDLATSPKRTNYERYFADQGTLEEIKHMVSFDICGTGEVIDGRCRCEIGDLALGNSCGCVDAFFDWLQQEATV